MSRDDHPAEVSDRASLHLGAVLDLKAAAGLHQEILALRGHDLVLNASDVTRLGGQCLQVLLAAMFAWQADGKSFSFDHPSPSFISALDMFGFAFEGSIHRERLA
jgi:chemotaxis protein CheX